MHSEEEGTDGAQISCVARPPAANEPDLARNCAKHRLLSKDIFPLIDLAHRTGVRDEVF
jgi:hypothetical protein